MIGVYINNRVNARHTNQTYMASSTTHQTETVRETRSKCCPTPLEARSDKRDTQDASDGEQTASTAKIQRVRKRQRKSPLTQTAGESGSNQGGTFEEQVSGVGRQSVRKRSRNWALWTPATLQLFSDALVEHGRDFEKVHFYMAQRQRKRQQPRDMWKNKDQVRYMYYRTLNNAGKLIEKYEGREALPHTKAESTDGIDQREIPSLSEEGADEKQQGAGDSEECSKKGVVKRDDLKKDDVRKHTRNELVAILAYLELKKRLRKDEAKFGSKYIELKNRGSTVIRVKGRNVRVKLPVCKAFKKDADKDDETQTQSLMSPTATPLLSRLCIHIAPVANRDFTVVQQAAHNPRVKLQVPLTKSLSSVISYLESKWATRQSDQQLHLSVPSLSPADMRDAKEEAEEGKSDVMEVDGVGQLDKRKWSKSDVGDLTVGDVYKSVGCPRKFCLNFAWTEKRREASESNPFPALCHLLDLLTAADQQEPITSNNCQATVSISHADANEKLCDHSVAVSQTIGARMNLLHRLNSADKSRLDGRLQADSVIQLQTGNSVIHPTVALTDKQLAVGASTLTPTTCQNMGMSQAKPVVLSAMESATSGVTSSTDAVAFVVPSAVLRPSGVGGASKVAVTHGMGGEPLSKKIRLDSSGIRIMSPTGMKMMMSYTQPSNLGVNTTSASATKGVTPSLSTASKGRRAIRFTVKQPTRATKQRALLAKASTRADNRADLLPGQGHFTIAGSNTPSLPSAVRVRAIAPKTTVSTSTATTIKLSVVQRAMQAANIAVEKPPVLLATPLGSPALPLVDSVTSALSQSAVGTKPSLIVASRPVQSPSLVSPQPQPVTSPLAVTTNSSPSIAAVDPRPVTPPLTSSSTSLSLELLLTPPSKMSSAMSKSHSDFIAPIQTEDALLEFPSHEQSEGFLSAVANATSLEGLDGDKSLDASVLLHALSGVPLGEEESRLLGRAGMPLKSTPSPVKSDLSDFQWLSENSISRFLLQSPGKETSLDVRDSSMGFRQLPEMDMAICSVLEENSVDYVSKFKDLAAEIAPMGMTPNKQDSGTD